MEDMVNITFVYRCYALAVDKAVSCTGIFDLKKDSLILISVCQYFNVVPWVGI